MTATETCPLCGGTGWRLFDDGDYEYAVECGCGIRQKQIMDGRLSFANIPKALCGVRLGSFRTDIYNDVKNRKKAVTAAKIAGYWLGDFADMKSRGMGLYIYSGAKGSGKTFMAAGIANELISMGVQVRFATSLQILAEVRACWSADAEYGSNRLISDLSAAEVLIIDDFGMEDGSRAWVQECFCRIIDRRNTCRMVTVFTSCKNPMSLTYGAHISGRIMERTYQIPFPEEDLRESIARENMRELAARI